MLVYSSQTISTRLSRTAQRAAQRTDRTTFTKLLYYDSGMSCFSKKESQNPDWFEAGIAVLEPTIEGKRTSLVNFKREPSEKTLATHRQAKNNVQQTARRCANDYWLTHCHIIQLSADCGNIWAMFNGMKKAFGPSVTKIAPITLLWSECPNQPEYRGTFKLCTAKLCHQIIASYFSSSHVIKLKFRWYCLK